MDCLCLVYFYHFKIVQYDFSNFQLLRFVNLSGLYRKTLNEKYAFPFEIAVS